MMKLPRNLKNSLGHLGRLLVLIGIVMFLPLIVGVYYQEWMYSGNYIYLGFILPGLVSISIGFLLQKRFESKRLSLVQGLFLTGLGWILISFFCSLPYIWISEMSIINSYFEAVSGFTTTGITMITDISPLPQSLIFWRSLTQWIGGLGIITFFLFIGRKGISEHILFRGESHKIKSSRPVPNVTRTIKYLWIIYCGFTGFLALFLFLEGTSIFDAINHSFTTLSTGGFSPHNASIEYYRLNGFDHYKLIEYTITIFMIIGGTNFVVHYRVLRGKVESLINNLEMRLWWIILIFSTFLIMLESGIFTDAVEPLFRNTIFQVASIASTTGFQTEFIGNEYFGALAKQIFLVLMVVGGCVSSTGGGIKVRRVGIMLKGIWNRIKRASRPKEMRTPLMVDDDKVDESQLERIFIIFVLWIFIIIVGALLTALLTNFGSENSLNGAIKSASGIFSALGNIGPTFMTVKEIVSLNPIIKLFYTFAMLVGRLEILPIFILLNREVWRS